MAPDSTIELSVSQVSVVEPRVLRPPRPPGRGRRLDRRAVIIGGAAVLVAIIVAAVALGGNHTAPHVPAIAAVAADTHEAVPELQMDPVPVGDPGIEAALRMARTGRGQEAATRLKTLQRERPDDAQVPYALGRVYDGLGWPRPMIDAYRDALHKDPSLRQDAALIRDLIDQLDSRSTWSVAAYMLEHDIGRPAIAALETTASHHPSPTVRDRAARIRARLAK